jgi:probable F420-dependent oxidoreductase
MEYGLILPSYRPGASAAGIEQAAAAAHRLGWSAVFTTDHVLVDPSPRAADYAHIFDPLITLAHVAARVPDVAIGISVLVVPMRNAVLLAKELATLDVLSGGRLIVGVGVGWNRVEFGNLGAGEVFGRRGAYLDEAIELWRYLWGGGEGPWQGRFHEFGEVRYGPRPVRGADTPIWVGGTGEAALRRAGRLGQAYHATTASPAAFAERIPVIRAAAEAAGRPMPLVTGRVRVDFAPRGESRFHLLAGTTAQMQAELRAYAEAGVNALAFDFVETDPTRHMELIERFAGEVLAGLS